MLLRWVRLRGLRAVSSQANALRHVLQSVVAESGEKSRPLLEVYDDLVRQGGLREDAAQRKVARRLNKLSVLLQSYTPPPPTPLPPLKAPATTAAPAGGKERPDSSSPSVPVSPPLPSKPPPSVQGANSADIDQCHTPSVDDAAQAPAAAPLEPPPAPRVLRGLYIVGKVGTGKSMLMDLFFHHCLVAKKRRVHFHEFMLEVHARIHAWKKRALEVEGRSRHIDLRPERNAIVQVAREVAAEATVLCFDEFQVTDVADAVIMVRLFSELWSAGVVMVATSNREPDELYQDGINRPYFLPFIGLLSRQCLVVHVDSSTDHRYGFERLPGSYHHPLGRATDEALDRAFLEMAGGPGKPTSIAVMMGRRLSVPEARAGVCRFSFDQLCKADVFAADYKAIASHFHTVVLSGVPRMSSEKHNEARRFITLIDVLYEKRIRLVVGADAAPHELFNETKPTSQLGMAEKRPVSGQTWMTVKEGGRREGVDAAQELLVSEGELSSVKELAFAFQRAASRLVEMSSSEYQENHRRACAHLYDEEAEDRVEQRPYDETERKDERRDS